LLSYAYSLPSFSRRVRGKYKSSKKYKEENNTDNTIYHSVKINMDISAEPFIKKIFSKN
jgi:hypothetical protein